MVAIFIWSYLSIHSHSSKLETNYSWTNTTFDMWFSFMSKILSCKQTLNVSLGQYVQKQIRLYCKSPWFTGLWPIVSWNVKHIVPLPWKKETIELIVPWSVTSLRVIVGLDLSRPDCLIGLCLNWAEHKRKHT